MIRMFRPLFFIFVTIGLLTGCAGMGGSGGGLSGLNPDSGATLNANGGSEQGIVGSNGGQEGGMSAGNNPGSPGSNGGGALSSTGPVDIPVTIAKLDKQLNVNFILVTDDNFDDESPEDKDDDNSDDQADDHPKDHGKDHAEEILEKHKNFGMKIKGLAGAVENPEKKQIYLYVSKTKKEILVDVNPDGSFDEVTFEGAESKDPIVVALSTPDKLKEVEPPLVLERENKNHYTWRSEGRLIATGTFPRRDRPGVLVYNPSRITGINTDLRNNERKVLINTGTELKEVDEAKTLDGQTLFVDDDVLYGISRRGPIALYRPDENQREQIVRWELVNSSCFSGLRNCSADTTPQTVSEEEARRLASGADTQTPTTSTTPTTSRVPVISTAPVTISRPVSTPSGTAPVVSTRPIVLPTLPRALTSDDARLEPNIDIFRAPNTGLQPAPLVAVKQTYAILVTDKVIKVFDANRLREYISLTVEDVADYQDLDGLKKIDNDDLVALIKRIDGVKKEALDQ